MKEKFLNDLNAWLPTDYHRNDCIAYGEGQLCCLDDAQRGRQFVTEWLEKNFRTYVLVQAGEGDIQHIIVSHSKDGLLAEIDKISSEEIHDDERRKQYYQKEWDKLRKMVKQHAEWEPGEYILGGTTYEEWTLVIVG